MRHAAPNTAIPPAALERACTEIYTRWRRFVTEAEAREQEQNFRARCQAMTAAAALETSELDAVLGVVADVMSAA